MGDVAKGIKSFKKGMASDVTEEGSQKNISENQDSSENQDIDKNKMKPKKEFIETKFNYFPYLFSLPIFIYESFTI